MSYMPLTLADANAYRQLQPAEKAFVDAYVSDLEREAARRNERISNAAYWPIPVAVYEASRGLLDRPLVRAAVRERIDDLARASELTPHRVVKELMTLSFSSMEHYMRIGEDGQPWFDLQHCTPEQLAAIQSIEIEEGLRGRKFKFKLHPKLDALKTLAQTIGLLEADNGYWREEQKRPAVPQLTSDATQDSAADLYSRLINE
jgi:hypothetical protein